ncbi:LPS export ABC transporter periplasmic protein LptC [Maribacter algicola]|uniref:LPS export ABC transporter periplasmic protein LptC n=1 Tax=Meishania litoralis TaxID=3434685 RepID=A0ACC7LJT5_9FLAO
MAMLFFCCTDNYKRVGEEAQKKVYPRGIAENSVLTYSELIEPLEGEDTKPAKNIAVLRSPIAYNYENLVFPYRLFPEGLEVDFFDERGEKNKVRADYGIVYSATNLIDLQGNVVLETPDGKKLETPQLYYDQDNQWVFTQEVFKFTNPEDGTIMDGKGMDFNKNLSFLSAHKTYGLMSIKEK